MWGLRFLQRDSKGPWAGNWWHKVPDHHSGPQSPFVLEAEAHSGLHMALVYVYVCVPTCVSVCLAETMRSSKAPSLGSIPTLPEAGPEQVP